MGRASIGRGATDALGSEVIDSDKYKHEPPIPRREGRGVRRGAGDGLLSRELSPGVPSALSGLTTVFGMGTGVALTL